MEVNALGTPRIELLETESMVTTTKSPGLMFDAGAAALSSEDGTWMLGKITFLLVSVLPTSSEVDRLLV